VLNKITYPNLKSTNTMNHLFKKCCIFLSAMLISHSAGSQSADNPPPPAPAPGAGEVPYYACQTISGRYFSSGAGGWSDDFWYASNLVEPSNANTDYNRFQSGYSQLCIALRLKLVSAYAFQANCVASANSSLTWCLLPCVVDFDPADCGAWCQADWELDIQDCHDRRENSMRKAREEADALIRFYLMLYGGCE